MTDIETAEIERINKVRTFLMRPLLFAAVGMTLFGNLSVAQPSWGGWLSHGWAPVLYLLLVEVLMAHAIGSGWLWPVVVGVVLIAWVAAFISFFTLRDAAVQWGWHSDEAWLFPVIVDLAALALTCSLAGSNAKVRAIEHEAETREREAAEAEQSKGGRPKSEPVEEPPRTVREPEPKAGLEPERAPKHTKWSGKLVEEFGSNPDEWPSNTDIKARTDCPASSLSDAKKRARTVFEYLERQPA